jgi:hypothetical protein
MLGPPKPCRLDDPIAVSLEALIPTSNFYRHLEAKLWHGLRRFRRRGLENVNIEGLLIAAGQNLKRFLAATGWGRRHAPCGSLIALPMESQELSAVCGSQSPRPQPKLIRPVELRIARTSRLV